MTLETILYVAGPPVLALLFAGAIWLESEKRTKALDAKIAAYRKQVGQKQLLADASYDPEKNTIAHDREKEIEEIEKIIESVQTYRLVLTPPKKKRSYPSPAFRGKGVALRVAEPVVRRRATLRRLSTNDRLESIRRSQSFGPEATSQAPKPVS